MVHEYYFYMGGTEAWITRVFPLAALSPGLIRKLVIQVYIY